MEEIFVTSIIYWQNLISFARISMQLLISQISSTVFTLNN